MTSISRSSLILRRTVAIFFIALQVFAISTTAQTSFQKTFGDPLVNDNGYNLIQVSDGGFLIAGTQFDNGNAFESAVLIRTDADGDTLWTRRIRESLLDYSAGSVLETFDGGFAVAGNKGSLNSSVPYLLKLDSNGTLLWNKGYLWFAQERIHDFVQTSDSGFLLAGTFYDLNNEFAYFIRTDVNGDTLWTALYGEPGFNADVYSLAKTADHGFTAAGSIQNTATQDVDAFLMKIDSAGNFEWGKGYGGTLFYDYAQHVETTFDGGCILAAVSYSFGPFADYWLLKTDLLGNLMWSRTFGGGSDDRSESVKQLPDGGFLLCGESASFSAGNFDSYLVRTDDQGDSLWTRVLNKTNNNEAYGLTLTSEGGFAFTGPYTNSTGNTDILLVKSDSTGFTGCSSMSVNTVSISTPLAVTTYHTLSFQPAQPSVISYSLMEGAGCSEELLCLDNSIGIPETPAEILIIPNPATHRIKITSSQFSNGIEVRVFSPDGSPLYGSRMTHLPVEIDLSWLAPGFYILELRTLNGPIRKGFIKQ